MNELILAANHLLENAPVSWAVCGGFAIDLFLGKETRAHGDIDICVFEKDRENILKHMLKSNWQVYEFRGNGKVRSLNAALSSEPGRNLMCTSGACELVKFYPCEEEQLLWYEFFHTGLKQLDYVEFLFNTSMEDAFNFDKSKGIKRELSKAILYHEGIPYLAPEIVLLYKASNADNAEYQYDFEQAYLHMNEEQKSWFLQGLDTLYPAGHKWRE